MPVTKNEAVELLDGLIKITHFLTTPTEAWYKEKIKAENEKKLKILKAIRKKISEGEEEL